MHRSAPARRKKGRKPTFETQGSLLLRSNIGEGRALLMLSVPMLTRRLSFSNWSMESWRTMPRSEPDAGLSEIRRNGIWESELFGLALLRSACVAFVMRRTSLNNVNHYFSAPVASCATTTARW